MTSESSEGRGRRRLHAAVIGSGFIGPHHVEAIRRGGYADVVVLAGHTAAHVESKAAALGLERWTTDVDSVIDDAAIDVVHVCTCKTSHVPLGEAALRAGKHVVMGKPLAVDSAVTARLMAAARTADRHAATTFTYRGYSPIAATRCWARPEPWSRPASWVRSIWPAEHTCRTGASIRPKVPRAP
jgi:predicted dehydrogenase